MNVEEVRDMRDHYEDSLDRCLNAYDRACNDNDADQIRYWKVQAVWTDRIVNILNRILR